MQRATMPERVSDDIRPSYWVGVFPLPQELANEPAGGRAWDCIGVMDIDDGLSIAKFKPSSLKDSAIAEGAPDKPMINAQVEKTICVFTELLHKDAVHTTFLRYCVFKGWHALKGLIFFRQINSQRIASKIQGTTHPF